MASVATTKADEKVESSEPDNMTAQNITNEELVTLVWFTAGSPCGSVQGWLDHCNSPEISVW